jgi:DNA uptake protein ComE-like DNA-binding protein
MHLRWRGRFEAALLWLGVAARGNNSTHSPEDWLIESDRRSDDPEHRDRPKELTVEEGKPEESEHEGNSITPEAAQWLVSPGTAVKERKPKRIERKPERKPEPAPPEPRESKEFERTTRSLEEEQAKNAELQETLRRRETEVVRTLTEREAEFAQALRERDEALKEREAELEKQLSQGYEQREADLNRQFDRRQVELEKQLAVLEDRLDAREAELRGRATQREAKLMTRIEVLQSQLADAKLGMSETPEPKRSRRDGSKKNGLDLNLASFEELRELGLSVTQSARVIAYRDTRGGFDSMEELDEIPGLPKDSRNALRNRLRL